MTEQQVPPEPGRRMTHRLVGAAVLVALAAILIPAILDFRSDDATAITGTNIPDRPEGFRVEEITLTPRREPATQPPPATRPPPAAAEVPATPPTAAEPTPDPGPAITTRDPDLQGYVVQVGSFSSEANATALRDRLRSAGYSAFLDRITIDGRPVVRVLVGPDARREQSERARDRLAAELDLSGVVIGYE